MNKGIFITFEGVDGSGKTTISKLVADKLIKQGFNCIYTREPGGIDIAEQIRDVILDPKNTKMDAKTEALLYAASRRQHLIEKIVPALNEGAIVICDRFVHSSLAYQGVARELGFDEVYNINEFAIEGIYPAKTIFLDLNEEEGLKRIQNRTFKDRLDQESLEFHKKVTEGYKLIKDRFSKDIIIVDASQSIDTVCEEALKKVIEVIDDFRSN